MNFKNLELKTFAEAKKPIKGVKQLFLCMLFFRRLTSADAELLAKIGSISLLESHGHSAPASTMQEYVDKNFSVDTCRTELDAEENIFYAVFFNNEPAGYYKIILSCADAAVPLEQATKMERLYLLKEFYGLQLGKSLLQHAFNFSKKESELGMWLTVWQKNDRAINFYKKWGFKIMGEGKFTLTATRYNPTWIMLLQY